jgi:ABC-type lipoprotein export system ATPase subunit
MLPDNFVIENFEPVKMSVENIGPFHDRFELDLTDSNGDPCNFFLLVSENGQGKTTLLDVMVVLMSMLQADRIIRKFGHEDLDRLIQYGTDSARAQLDILVRFYREGEYQTAILSLIASPEGTSSIRPWTETELKKIGADFWSRFGYRRHRSGHIERIGSKDTFIEDLLSCIHNKMSRGPDGFGESSFTVPTLLYFTAYRDIPKVINKGRSISAPEDWTYRIVKKFLSGDKWVHSLDNLLVWLKWIDDERFERAIDDVNRWVFRDTNKKLEGVQKDPPEAIVSNRGTKHRLDRLSSGEKSLVQMILRIGALMTRNTWVVIDELDVHLHPKWQHRILNTLKKIAVETPGLRIIATTHSREILTGFEFETKEPGLRKGGHIIEENL